MISTILLAGILITLTVNNYLLYLSLRKRKPGPRARSVAKKKALAPTTPDAPVPQPKKRFRAQSYEERYMK